MRAQFTPFATAGKHIEQNRTAHHLIVPAAGGGKTIVPPSIHHCACLGGVSVPRKEGPCLALSVTRIAQAPGYLSPGGSWVARQAANGLVLVLLKLPMVRARLSVADILYRGVVPSLVGVCVWGIGTGVLVHRYTLTLGKGSCILHLFFFCIPCIMFPQCRGPDKGIHHYSFAACDTSIFQGSRTCCHYFLLVYII